MKRGANREAKPETKWKAKQEVKRDAKTKVKKEEDKTIPIDQVITLDHLTNPDKK